MSTTLYRKYRPQIFDEVVGQHHVKVTLQNELLSGRVAHAYLFTGPRGVGKTTVARLLAKAVNCLHPHKDGGPDDTCDACVEIRVGRSLDLIEIDAASNTGVDHVREHIIENSRFTPSRWKYKVFIIDEVHMLSLSAFNALLKTLEEPPEHAIFILATTEVHKVPETIISRCQRFDFRQLRHEDLVERLRRLVKQEGVAVDDEVLAAIARFARGSARDAENLLGQVLTLGESPITMEQAELVLPRSDFHLVLQLFEALVQNDTTAGIRLVNRLVQDGVNLGQFTQNMIEFLRKALLLKVSPQLEMFSSLELVAADEQKLLKEIENVRLHELERMIRIFLSEEQHLRLSFVPQLPLELAVLEITTGDEPPVAVVQPAAQRPIPVAPSAPTPKDAPAKKKEALNKAKIQQSPNAKLSLTDVQTRWGTVLDRLQKASHSLRLTLNVAILHAVEDDAIVLGVGYDFHRERLEMPRHRALIQEILADVFDRPVELRTVISDQAPRTQSFEREANVELVDVAFDKPPTAVLRPPAADSPASGNWEAIVEMFGGKSKT
ncbi:MAG: DNA polymerase III subunit gamma/tau [Candidatus Kerfeldbacteria bacterium]|nr:DNA polymerase III subunit gamma/tau [Candidatus Kerfeldbacteria bacterium]